MRIALLNRISASPSFRFAIAPIGIVLSVYLLFPLLVAGGAICLATAIAMNQAGHGFSFTAGLQKYLANLEMFTGELTILTISGILAACVWSRGGKDLWIFGETAAWIDVLLGVTVAVGFHYAAKEMILPWLHIAAPVGSEWMKPEYEPIATYSPSRITQLAGAFFLSALYRPVVETILFVGLLYRRVRSLWGVTASLLLCSITFAAVHHNKVVFLDFFLLGLVNFTLFEIRKSLAAPLFQHIAYNIIVFVTQVVPFSGTQ